MDLVVEEDAYGVIIAAQTLEGQRQRERGSYEGERVEGGES